MSIDLTAEEIRQEIEERMLEAHADAVLTGRIDPSSYDHGETVGFLAALVDLLMWLRENER